MSNAAPDARFAVGTVGALVAAAALTLALSRCLSPGPAAAGASSDATRRPASSASFRAARAVSTGACSAFCCLPRPHAAFLLAVCGVSCLWFGSSLAIINLNRFVFGYKEHLSFPLVLTAAHILVKGVLAALAVLLSGAYLTPELLLLSPLARLRERWRRMLALHALDGAAYATLVAPLGVFTALDVWLSNASLRSIDIAVYTTAKSTSLFWNLALSVALGLVAPSPRLIAVVLALFAGVLLCSLKQIGADPAGLACALAAAACSAARWVLSEQLLSRSVGGGGGLSDGGPVREPPGVLLLAALMAPASLLTLLLPLIFELSDLVRTDALRDPRDAQLFMAAIFGGGTVALALVAAELQLVKMTSALSLGVIGHVKDVVAILLSVLVFHDVLSSANWAGVALTILSTSAYTVLRARGVGGRIPEAAEPGIGAGVAAAKEGDLAPSSAVRSSRSKPRLSSWGQDGVDTTGFGTLASTVVGVRFAQLNLDSDEEDEGESSSENNHGSWDLGQGAGHGGTTVAESASLLGGLGGGAARRSDNRAGGSGRDAVTTATTAAFTAAAATAPAAVDDDDSDDAALEAELDAAAGLDRQPPPQVPRPSRALPPALLPFGLSALGGRTKPLGRGHAHAQDVKSAAAAQALAQATALRRASEAIS